MTPGIVALSFGEPATTDREVVVEYLTRIFHTNADLEDADSEEEAWERARELAERRAPGLIEEYEEIGASPLNEQSRDRVAALETELADRNLEGSVHLGMQFMEPLIPDVAEELAAEGVDPVVGLPMYPLCGPSTSVQALDDLQAAINEIDGYDPTVQSVTGWHRHPQYPRIRADAIAAAAAADGVDLQDPDTTLVFSAHGTPTQYIDDGSRYVEYVEEYAQTVAALLDVETYRIGYQNHANRGVEWTQPAVEDVVTSISGDRIVVDPTSFVHEQSETLAELDHDLREDAEAEGLEFTRVPVPHDDERLVSVLADVVEPFVAGFDPSARALRRCECRPAAGTYCLNSGR